MTFKQLFFRIYDRKIMSGAMSFSQTGIQKNDFTKLCTEDDFAFDRETLTAICNRMEVAGTERAELFAAAEEIWKGKK